MKPIITNFRGLNAVVVHREDTDRATLMRVLRRLGVEAATIDPKPFGGGAPLDCDLVLFDADEDSEASWASRCSPDMSLIALIGSEAPSRLARVVRHRCDSHILKPIRTNGVFTAVLLAVNERTRRRQNDREIETLKHRLAGRRLVMKAILRLMSHLGIDEDTAYERLRSKAMKLRLPIDEIARECLGLRSDVSVPPAPPKISRSA